MKPFDLRGLAVSSRFLFAFFVFLVGFAGMARADEGVDSGGFAEGQVESLRQRWQLALETLRVPGMAVSVVKDDQVILLETFGLRDVERGLPVTPDSPFYIASCTKAYVAFAIQMLADEGKIDIDRPVKTYLNRMELADPDLTKTMTVRDLMTHKVGLNSFPIVLLDAYTGEITEDRFYHFLKSVESPGKVIYSNLHFTLAGRVIEAVSGKPWREFLAERLFDPAGMTRTTGYADTMYSLEDVAFPSRFGDDEFELCLVRKTDRTMHAAGGLGGSVRDLVRWLRLNLNFGSIDGTRLLSEERAREMQTLYTTLDRPGGGKRPRMGFGLAWFHGEYHGHPYWQHGGGYVGTSADLSFLPEDGIGVAAVANSSGMASALLDFVVVDIYNALLGIEERDPWPGMRRTSGRRLRDMRRRTPKGTNPVETEGALTVDAREIEGIYRHPYFGTLTVSVREGKMMSSLGDMPMTTISTGENRFTMFSGNGMSMDGELAIEGKEVPAVVLSLGGTSVRFDRGE